MIDMKSRFESWKPPKIEDGKPTEYGWIVKNVKGLDMGNGTDIGAFTYINAKNGVIIEDFVQIGSHCSVYSISTIDQKEGKVVLKRNCRVGSHSIIMPGVTVGRNSIIGSFSFVNKDVPDDVLVYGIPAKVVRNLTDEEKEGMDGE